MLYPAINIYIHVFISVCLLQLTRWSKQTEERNLQGTLYVPWNFYYKLQLNSSYYQSDRLLVIEGKYKMKAY